MSHRSIKTSLRFCLLAALPWLSATPAPAQQYMPLPPNSFIGNLTGFPNAGSAVSLPQLIAALSGAGLQLDQMTKVGTFNYSISPNDRIITTLGPFTSSGTWTLPAANLMTPGHALVIVDLAGGVGGSKTLTIAAGGTDRINGVPGGSATISNPYGAFQLVSDGVSAWNAQPLGGVSVAPGGGLVSSVSAPCSQSAITAFGMLSAAACINPQTGTSYAIADSDRGKLITASNSAAQAYTLAQAGAASAFAGGWYVDITNLGTNPAGIITITPTISTIGGASTLNVYPGQSVRIVSDGTNYQIINNVPRGGRVLLNTLTASNSAILSDTTSITGSFTEYEIVFENILPATNNVSLEFQVHSGGAFQGASYLGTNVNAGSTVLATNSTGFILLSSPALLQNTGAGFSGSLTIYTPSNTAAPKTIRGKGGHYNGTVMNTQDFAGFWNGGNGVVDGFEVFTSSGNITSGVMKVYGIQ
jgi:hypothetical protein